MRARSQPLPGRLVMAANNGGLGGGEVMLLAAARAARDLGVKVSIIGPQEEHGVVAAAQAAGFEAVSLSGDRLQYMRELRRWDSRRKDVLLWCHGLVPGVATMGHRHRIVQLHRVPRGLHVPATRAATLGARAVVAPSRHLAEQWAGAVALQNWTEDHGRLTRPTTVGETLRVGFIGRYVEEKGLDVLVDALSALAGTGHSVSLTLAGDAMYGEIPTRTRAALASATFPVTDLGWLEGPDRLLERVDVLCVPSSQPESFGLVIAEAMSARVPVIVTDAGAFPEVVGPGHPWVARAGDQDDLRRMIAAYAEAGDHQRSDAVARARARWEQLWSPDAGRARMSDFLGALGVLPSPE